MSDLFDSVVSPAAEEKETDGTRRRDRRQKAKRRAQRRRNVLSFLVMIAALALLVGGGWVLVKPLLAPHEPEAIEDYPGPGHGQVQVVVEKGETGSDIAKSLAEADVIAKPEPFIAAYTANPRASSIQAGTYDLQEQMRSEDALRALLDPATRADMTLTVPEGTRAEAIYERIASILQVDVSEVRKAAKKVAKEDLPKSASGHIEGWLQASTYNLSPSDTPATVLKQMVSQTETTLKKLDVAPAKQEEMLTIASIVEAEVVLPQDRGKVARVIENRLEGCSGDKTIGMDSTYAYGLDKPAGQITVKEWHAKAPYNTRTVAGLPPTPINSPGQEALKAAIDPPTGGWCYFVTVNLDSGETLFAKTYEQHQKNRQLAREWLKKNR